MNGETALALGQCQDATGPDHAGRYARWYLGLAMTKTELHRLVDALPDESLDAAAVLLMRARDPVVAKLDAAPYDDEPLTEEDQRAINEGLSEPGIPWSEVESDLRSD